MAGIIHDLDGVLSGYPKQTPVVVFSSMAPIVSLEPESASRNISELARYFQDLSKSRDVLMPSFTPGYGGAVLNLDSATSRNGLLSEFFRAQHPLNRTVSAFFAFTAVGPSQDHLFTLEPEHAWGEGSLYEWIEQNDSTIVTIGLPPYVCSFQHRAEYLEMERVSYRHLVNVSGTVKIRGRQRQLSETLFARNAGVSVDFRPICPSLPQADIHVSSSAGVTVSAISARKKLELARNLIQSNNSIFLT
jgi:aminoglycoside N3'-acetyltransferase